MSSAATVIETDMASLQGMVGTQLGPTDWALMTQEEVNRFADLTDDHNFIHVDPERAKQTPFKGTIAHGFLTLSLLAPVTLRLQVRDAPVSINYGMDKVRFPAPLPVGSRWRAQAEITEVGEVTGGVQVNVNATIEIEGSDRPAVAAELLLRFYS
jgi:acyl dehydratase